MMRFEFYETPAELAAKKAGLRADYAAVRIKLALARLMLAVKYSPDQPRVPAGSPDGGQWTGGDGYVRVAANDRGPGGIATDANTGNSKPENRTARVVLPTGQTVVNPYSKTGYLVSPTQDLSPVAAAGREAGARYKLMLASPDSDVQRAALPQFAGSIAAAVGQGGTFDYQRSGNFITGFTQLPQYRDVSNFNVGLYMQQTGVFSEEETLSTAGNFAKHFSSNYKPEEPYGLDPRTAFFIKIGYRAGTSGGYGSPGK